MIHEAELNQNLAGAILLSVGMFPVVAMPKDNGDDGKD